MRRCAGAPVRPSAYPRLPAGREWHVAQMATLYWACEAGGALAPAGPPALWHVRHWANASPNAWLIAGGLVVTAGWHPTQVVTGN